MHLPQLNMKPFKDSPLNSQDPFQKLLAPEFEIDTTNLLNYEAGASSNSEQKLPPLPVTQNNSAEDIASFSNALILTQSFPNTDFTPPRKK